VSLSGCVSLCDSTGSLFVCLQLCLSMCVCLSHCVCFSLSVFQERKLTKSQVGHLRATGQSRLRRFLQEFRSARTCQIKDILKVDLFEKGEFVHVQGTSKGKGFQGVMKRHNFGGGPASHGSMFHRAPGSIGSSSFPSRVLKNKKLPGHMGSRRVTVKKLRVVDVLVEENLLLVSGAIPGPTGGLVLIRKLAGG